MPVMSALWMAAPKESYVQSQPGELISKKMFLIAGSIAHYEGQGFSPQYQKEEKKKNYWHQYSSALHIGFDLICSREQQQLICCWGISRCFPSVICSPGMFLTQQSHHQVCETLPRIPWTSISSAGWGHGAHWHLISSVLRWTKTPGRGRTQIP